MGNIAAVGIIGIFFFSVLLIFLTPEVYAHFDMSQPAFSSDDLITDCKDAGFGDDDNDDNDRGDADGDAICDAWEDQSAHTGLIVNFPDNARYVYECGAGTADPICPSKNHKDIFVEIDWQGGHKPGSGVVNLLRNTFAAIENRHFAIPNPDGTDGINLHIQVDEKILQHYDAQGDPKLLLWEAANLPESMWGFPQVKKEHFGTGTERTPLSDWTDDPTGPQNWRAKQQVFHYALFVHGLVGAQEIENRTGMGEFGGNDFVVSLGNFAGGTGSQQEKAGTFMHELGHNLGLEHGGNVTINCKPNYFSVMSHSRQLPILYPGRLLDYSTTIQGERPGGNIGYLDETALEEKKGVAESDPEDQKHIYGPGDHLKRDADRRVDWNRDGIYTGFASEDINNFADCAISYAGANDSEILHGYDDWDKINFNFREDTESRGGVGSTVKNLKLKKVMPGPLLSADELIKRFPEWAKDRAEIEKHFSSIEYTSLEFTRQMAINQHKSRIDTLDYIIENATGSRYNPQMSDGKQQGNVFERLKDLVDEGNYKKASMELEELRKNFSNEVIVIEINKIIDEYENPVSKPPITIKMQQKDKIDNLESMIETMSVGKFQEPTLPYEKETANEFEMIKDLIQHENFEKASMEVEALKKEFTHPEILEEIDDILLSYELATQFTPTEVHTKYGDASCGYLDVSKVKTGKIQVEYCIVNGKLVSGNLDFDKKTFVLDISPTSDGEVTVSVPKELIESKTMIPSSKFKVSTNGKPLEFHTENSDSENIALTIGFPSTVSSIEIVASDFELLRPLIQFKNGIAAKDVECKTGYELIFKDLNGYPACVSPDGKDRLVSIGWAKP